MAEEVFEGAPLEVEVALRSALRAVQLAIALPATLALYWLEEWLLLPLPLAGSFLVYESLVAQRREPRTTLAVSDSGAVVEDALRGQRIELRWADVEVATASRHRGRGGDEVVVMLADRVGPQLAVRFRVDGPAEPTDIDLDAVDRALGGSGGALPSVHAVAPLERMGRLRFDAPRALEVVRGAIAGPAWTRGGARLWRGVAPPLDPYGFHLEEHGEWLVLDGERYEVRRGGERIGGGSLRGVRLCAASRRAALRLRAGEAPVEAEVPLAGLALPEGPRIWFPAQPPPGADPVELGPDDAHTHFPEGAAVIGHLLRALPADALPAGLLDVRSARPG